MGLRDAENADQVISAMYNLSPKIQVAFGVVCLLGGIALTVVAWEAGWIVGLTVLMIAVGLGVLLNGREALKRETAAREQWDRVLRKQDEILDDLADAKRRGKRAVYWLKEQGFTDMQVRTHLLNALQEREGA